LEAAIGQLCETITNSGKIKVDSIIDIQQALKDGESLLNIYRIVQELFTNTLKHAQATQIRLKLPSSMTRSPSFLKTMVSALMWRQPLINRWGYKTFGSRVSRLQGDLKIQSSPNGSTFIIEIPIGHAN